MSDSLPVALPPMPPAIQALPEDKHGRPIPWFVAVDDAGVPDHRVARFSAVVDAVRFKKCWLCGRPCGRWVTFPIGPMCAVSRITAEPPSHRECAGYAVRACPFLRTPGMQRRERNLPEDKVMPAGTMIMRNPGVTALWTTRDWTVLRQPNGVLFRLGDATELEWVSRGRAATRAEVLAAIESGMPLLLADAQEQGPAALADLERGRENVMSRLPPEPSACPCGGVA